MTTRAKSIARVVLRECQASVGLLSRRAFAVATVFSPVRVVDDGHDIIKKFLSRRAFAVAIAFSPVRVADDGHECDGYLILLSRAVGPQPFGIHSHR